MIHASRSFNRSNSDDAGLYLGLVALSKVACPSSGAGGRSFVALSVILLNHCRNIPSAGACGRAGGTDTRGFSVPT